MTGPLDREPWEAAWRGVGARGAPMGVREELLRRYAERHRAYHTPVHLADCLSQLAAARRLCEHPDEVALALWFHDAIYRSRRGDNEALCAQWLARAAVEVGTPPGAIARMEALVMATRHAVHPTGRDARVLVDIDLSILGASRDRFLRYDAQIRREYWWVPMPMYRRGRRKVLAHFLARPRIYATAEFQARLEMAARANLAAALRRLTLPADAVR
jgi:predicted metal-dependent HD superfamily phosphohydrolase